MWKSQSMQNFIWHCGFQFETSCLSSVMCAKRVFWCISETIVELTSPGTDTNTRPSSISPETCNNDNNTSESVQNWKAIVKDQRCFAAKWCQITWKYSEEKNSSMELAVIWENLTCSDLACSDLACSDLACSDLPCSDLAHSDLACSDLACFFCQNSYFFHLYFTTWELI